MKDNEYRQEHQFDSMLLWRCEYDLTGPFDTARWVSYVWSTSPATARDMQEHWNHINPGYYQLDAFSTCAVPPKDDSELSPHILEIKPRKDLPFSDSDVQARARRR